MKRLYRSTEDKMIGGVCGGIAEYFGIDPSIVRILLLFLFLFGGSGGLLYLLCWLILPTDRDLYEKEQQNHYNE
ncbi:MAG: PspC domain-containing protein [Tissierellia bacterium]|nr:PspC domain-containing protein [Tissierellia bacterium]